MDGTTKTTQQQQQHFTVPLRARAAASERLEVSQAATDVGFLWSFSCGFRGAIGTIEMIVNMVNQVKD